MSTATSAWWVRPRGYVGYEEGGQLTNAVKRKPFSVLLFDEIEKAHPRILDKFLQILEDGRLTDGKGETVSFAESVIIFTSNIGAADVQVSDDAGSVREAFLAQVQHHFVHQMKRPELLNRIGDNIVPFNFITVPGFLANIAGSKLAQMRRKLYEKYGIRALVFTDEAAALEAIAATTETRMGGRGVLNQLSKYLIDPLAEFLFEYGDDPGYVRGKAIRVRQRAKTAHFLFDRGLAVTSTRPIGNWIECTEVEGPGKRFAIWTQGCHIRCADCCNPEPLPLAANRLVEAGDMVQRIAEARDRHAIEGITLLGGEPLIQARGLTIVAREARRNRTHSDAVHRVRHRQGRAALPTGAGDRLTNATWS